MTASVDICTERSCWNMCKQVIRDVDSCLVKLDKIFTENFLPEAKKKDFYTMFFHIRFPSLKHNLPQAHKYTAVAPEDECLAWQSP